MQPHIGSTLKGSTLKGSTLKLLLAALLFLSLVGAVEAQSDYLAPPQVMYSTAGANRYLFGSYVEPQYTSQYCTQMQQYGVRFTWIAIPWIGIEPLKGVFDWRKADPIIQSAHNCGFDIGFHILSVSSWATLPPPPTNARYVPSMPPRDLRDYYNFVFQLASHYKGQVSRYSIENEAHASTNWASTPESYFQMLQTAYRAVKAADPQALVEDSAISSSGFGILLINQLLVRGNQQGAMNFAQHYFAHYPSAGGDPIVINNLNNLQALIAQPESQRLLQWAPLLFQNHQYFDVAQIHYFGPWDDLQPVTDYVHSQLRAQADDKPLDFWEMGYGWNDMSTYDPGTHAQDEPKLFATAIGEGGLRVLNWEFNDYAVSEGHPGLISPNGPRPVALSFQIIAQKLNGGTSAVRLNLGPRIWGYKFTKTNGVVYVIWSTQPTKVTLPIKNRRVLVTGINGQTTLADPKALSVGAGPIFVEAN